MFCVLQVFFFGFFSVYTNEVTGNKGIFLSPNYPQNYPELVNYTYIAHLEGYGPYVVSRWENKTKSKHIIGYYK